MCAKAEGFSTFTALPASIFIVFLRSTWASKQHHKENQQESASSFSSRHLHGTPLIIPDGVHTVFSSISSTLLSRGEDNLLACQHCSHNQWRLPKICHNHLLLLCQLPTSNSNLFTTKIRVQSCTYNCRKHSFQSITQTLTPTCGWGQVFFWLHPEPRK